jgi:Zn-finger protein
MALIQRVCKICGKTFETQECWDKRGNRLFCSRECSAKGRDYVSPMKGKHHTEESKKLMSENRKGINVGQDNPQFGKPLSEEHKAKISKTRIERGIGRGENCHFYGVHLRGDLSPNFGRKVSDETKQKLSMAMKGKPAWNKGTPCTWLKGRTLSDETKIKISKGNKGKKKSDAHKQKLREAKLESTPTGENSWNWKGGLTDLNHHIRTLPRYKTLCSDLMKEVDYTDAFTGVRGGVLSCHHIVPQNVIIRMYNIKTIDDARECPLLFDKHNMVVMLKSAHDKFHNIYGDDKNIYELTEAQIKELYTP